MNTIKEYFKRKIRKIDMGEKQKERRRKRQRGRRDIGEKQKEKIE